VKTCTVCGETKSLNEFHKNRAAPDGHLNQCKPCVLRKQAAYRAGPGREKYLAQARKYTKGRRGLKREYDAVYRQANRDKLLAGKRNWWAVNREIVRERARQMRALVVAHYGDACACCGSADRLSIDHVNGDGAEHRAEIGTSGDEIVRWLISNGFPDGFQILCMLCNKSKDRGERCRRDHTAAS